MTAPTSNESAAARAATYTLLAALFDRPLDAAGLAALRSPEMRAAFAAAGVMLPADFASVEREALRERLAIEFSHIFVSPVGKIMPHEGLMLAHEDDLSGDTTAQVARFMAEVGYRLPPESGRMADHLAVELSFTADLARREAAAGAEGAFETAARAHAIRHDFLTRHLGRWVWIAAQRIAARDAGTFYAEMARFMADFLAEDARSLRTYRVKAAE